MAISYSFFKKECEQNSAYSEGNKIKILSAGTVGEDFYFSIEVISNKRYIDLPAALPVF